MKTEIVHILPGLDRGGAEQMLFNLLSFSRRELRKQQLVVSLTDLGTFGPLIRDLGVEVVALQAPRDLRALLHLRELHTIISDRSPGTVCAWLDVSQLLCSILKMTCTFQPKLVWFIRRSYLEDEPMTLRNRIVRTTLRTLSRFADLHVFNSKAGLNSYKRVGYSAVQSALLLNGVDTERFRPNEEARNELRRSLNIGSTEFVLGFVGRLAKVKNFPLFVETVRLLVAEGFKGKCVIVGKGFDETNLPLSKSLRESGIRENCLLLGPQENMENIYPALDLLVVTSISEGFPNVVAEAMSCGVPVLSSAVGDAEEIIQHTGKVVHDDDPEHFASAILESQANFTSQKTRVECRSRVAKYFSAETCVREFYALMDRIES